jgi:Uma2 family endonuclease
MSALPALITEAEFLALPESMDRVELLDGEVIVPPSPSPGHQGAVKNLVYELEGWARRHGATVHVSPLDVRFGPGRILQPDVMVFLGGLAPEAAAPLTTIPDLCVEVLSVRRSYDRIVKREVYAEAGVREYWVVDPVQRCVEVYRGHSLFGVATETLESELLPGFSVEVATLFG